MRRGERKLKTPDVGILAVRLLFGVQSELFARAAQHGFDDLRPRHGTAEVANSDDGGSHGLNKLHWMKLLE